MSSVQGDPSPQDDPAPKRQWTTSEFINSTSFPLVAVLVTTVIIIVVLVLSGAIDSIPTVLGAVAGVLVALGGVIVATNRRK